MIDGGLAPRDGLQPILDGERFRPGQDVERQRGDLPLGGVKAVEGRRDGLPTRRGTRTHTSNTSGAPSVFMGAFVLFSVVFWCCGEGFGVSALR